MLVAGFLVTAFLVACSPKDAIASPPCGCLPGFVAGYWIESNNIQYKMVCNCYKFVTDVGSWAESMAYCVAMGATLVRIEGAPEKKWIDNKLKSMQSTTRHHLLSEPEYWIGATDLMCEGTWIWINATEPMKDCTDCWLAQSQDNCDRSTKNCLAMKRHVECKGSRCKSPVVGWFDDDCYKRKFYVCESDPISFP